MFVYLRINTHTDLEKYKRLHQIWANFYIWKQKLVYWTRKKNASSSSSIAWLEPEWVEFTGVAVACTKLSVALSISGILRSNWGRSARSMLDGGENFENNLWSQTQSRLQFPGTQAREAVPFRWEMICFTKFISKAGTHVPSENRGQK